MKNEEISLATKRAMAAALQEAMKKKEFSKITVKEIIEACNINRNTFYYHFADMYELLHWMFKEEAIGRLKEYDLVHEYDRAIAFVISYIQEKEPILRCTCNSIGREELKRYFQGDFIEIIDSVIQETQENMQRYLSAENRQYLCLFLTEATAGMLVRYIDGTNSFNRQQTPDTIPDLLRITITGFIQERGMTQERNVTKL